SLQRGCSLHLGSPQSARLSPSLSIPSKQFSVPVSTVHTGSVAQSGSSQSIRPSPSLSTKSKQPKLISWSQASPMPLKSLSSCPGLGTSKQLSQASPTLSESKSA